MSPSESLISSSRKRRVYLPRYRGFDRRSGRLALERLIPRLTASLQPL